jgi:hypothetical protein
MAELERTNDEIDNLIREWKLKHRDIAEVLGVSLERVQERWDWFRQEVYRRIAEGKPTSEIVAEVGLPRTAVAAFKARWTHGYRPGGIAVADAGSDTDELDSADVENAVVTTFGLERDLQRTLRENIAQLEPGLQIIDGGNERRSAAGLVDILCKGSDGALVVVELKAGLAKDAALGQVLGYGRHQA